MEEVEIHIDNKKSEIQLDDLDKLNTNWITEFIEKHNKYEEFYKENVETIKLVLIYLNEKKEVVSVKREKHLITQNRIKNDELVFLIDKYKKPSFSLYSLLRYNFNIEPEQLIDNTFHQDDYLTELTFTDDILWKPTINILQDINTLYLIYKEVKQEATSKNKKTRKNRIYLRLNDDYNNTSQRMKRNKKHRKTLRKRV